MPHRIQFEPGDPRRRDPVLFKRALDLLAAYLADENGTFATSEIERLMNDEDKAVALNVFFAFGSMLKSYIEVGAEEQGITPQEYLLGLEERFREELGLGEESD